MGGPPKIFCDYIRYKIGVTMIFGDAFEIKKLALH